MGEDDRSREAKKYFAVRKRVFFADLLITAVSILLFQFVFSRQTASLSGELTGNFYTACFVYVTAFAVFLYIVSFPLTIFGSYAVEHRFNLSEQRFPEWLADEAKKAALSYILFLVSVEVFYAVLRNFPVAWWAIVAVLWVLFTVAFSRIFPVLIIPLFFKYTPLDNDGLKKRISELGKKAGIRIMDVSEIDFSKKTKKANAALVGIGGSRKVILADTLVNDFTEEEIGAVMAHEFGHHKYGHIWQLLAFSGVSTLIILFVLSAFLTEIAVSAGFSGVGDLAMFPIIMLFMMFFSFLIMPLQNLFSRILERQADRFALELTGDPGSFVSVMEKLAAMNLSDKEPSVFEKVFFYDHPPVGERIAMARSVEQRLGA